MSLKYQGSVGSTNLSDLRVFDHKIDYNNIYLYQMTILLV